MLRIRLSRAGKRKQPAYRIVVADSRSPRDGAFLKIIGHYDPLTDPARLVVKEDEAVHWLQKGAQPSETAAKLLTRIGVMERAGRRPLRYLGKEVPPTTKEKKGAKAAAISKATPPETEAPVKVAATEPAPGAEAVAEAEAPEPAADAANEAPEAEGPESEPETASADESQEPA